MPRPQRRPAWPPARAAARSRRRAAHHIGLDALVAGDRQAAALAAVGAQFVRADQVERRLGLVGEPQNGRQRTVLRQSPQRLGAFRERRQSPALVDPDGGCGADLERDCRYHPECPLGAQEQLAPVRTRRRLRRASQLERPPRRRHPQPDDARVEAAVAGGRLPARARGGEPPTVANSNDCGWWPIVKPRSASSASASGPRSPGSSVATLEQSSSSSSRFKRRSSSG